MKYKRTPYDSKNKIPEKEFNDFCKEVYRLANEKFGTDDEGEPPVQIKVIDRTRFEYLHARPMPYRSWEDRTNTELLKERLNIAGSYLSNAQEQNRIVLYDLQEFFEEAKKEKNAKQN